MSRERKPEEASRWQQEFDALPEWAQQLVLGLQQSAGWGVGGHSHLLAGMTPETRSRCNIFHAVIDRTKLQAFLAGFQGALELADALTAPWPPPPPPTREKRVFNIVELAASLEDDDSAFDQPCCFGHRVESHAVYCHNDAWPAAPNKCRRNRDDYRHEDCPGFVPNPDYVTPDSDHD